MNDFFRFYWFKQHHHSFGTNCCGRSHWIFSLAPVVKPDLDSACTQLDKFGEFFKYPLWGVLGLFVQGLKDHSLEIGEFRSPAWACPLSSFPLPYIKILIKYIKIIKTWKWNLLQLSYCLCHLNAQDIRDIENWNLRKFSCVTGGWIVLAKW